MSQKTLYKALYPMSALKNPRLAQTVLRSGSLAGVESFVVYFSSRPLVQEVRTSIVDRAGCAALAGSWRARGGLGSRGGRGAGVGV